jgi:hypothetical protein
MKTRRRIAYVLLGVSLISFGIAYYSYGAYIDFLAIFEHYGIPEKAYSQHPKTAAAIFNFWFGIIGAIVGGFISLVFFVGFFIKSFGKNEQENN